MNIKLYQTHHTIADFDAIFSYIKKIFKEKSPGIHVFPELFLSGYPLQDLCLQKPFIDHYHEFIDELNTWMVKNIDSHDTCLLIGGLKYELSENGLPISPEKCCFSIRWSKSPKVYGVNLYETPSA